MTSLIALVAGLTAAQPSAEGAVLGATGAVRRPPAIAALVPKGPPIERGVALGLFSADDGYDYGDLLREIHALGATHVELTWVVWQRDLRATEIRRVPGWTATDPQILAAMKTAKDLGLHVTAFPILRLERAAKNEWRGRITPDDEDAWWESYRGFMLHAALLARQGRADRLCVGSELVSREHMRARWLDVIGAVRAEAPGLEILYSANWDHFREVSFWDAVDVAGMTAYFELTKSLDPQVEELVAGWARVKPALESFAATLGRPLVITEVGYPSLDGGVAWPWDETRAARVDQEEQRRGYEAFVESWSGTRWLRGVYFWNWFGFGGPDDTNYTPRGKPAAAVIERWYRSAPAFAR
ncbi:hypothetical protein L6R52_39415 [Myxococcota bacterium]|nr:hypothetical protein [Myxococcota bacterium]